MDDFLVLYVSMAAVYLLATGIAQSLVAAVNHLHDRKPKPMATRNKA